MSRYLFWFTQGDRIRESVFAPSPGKEEVGRGLTGFAVQARAAAPFPRRRRISVGDPREVQIVVDLPTASTCKTLRRELHTLE